MTSRSGVYVYSAWFYTDNKSLFEGQGGVIKMQLWNGNTALDFVQTELEPLLVNGSWVFASVKLGMPNKDVTHIRAEIWVRKTVECGFLNQCYNKDQLLLHSWKTLKI